MIKKRTKFITRKPTPRIRQRRVVSHPYLSVGAHDAKHHTTSALSSSVVTFVRNLDDSRILPNFADVNQLVRFVTCVYLLMVTPVVVQLAFRSGNPSQSEPAQEMSQVDVLGEQSTDESAWTIKSLTADNINETRLLESPNVELDLQDFSGDSLDGEMTLDLQAPTYFKIELLSDVAARLYIDGNLIANKEKEPNTMEMPINISAGTHTVRFQIPLDGSYFSISLNK